MNTPTSHSDSEDGARPTPGRNRISRRRMLQTSGLAAAATAFAGLTAGPAQAATGTTPATPQPSGSATRKRTGTIKDVKHVVILMQENRSFDHYFGSLDLAGVRGYGDKQVLTWQNGRTIYYDPDTRAEGYLLPYHADSLRYNAQNTSDRHRYFKEADIPFHHALAKAYTVGDHYFCSLDTSTSPNRIMMWAGTNDAAGKFGGPVVNNNGDYQYAYTFKTYPEVLQEAGVSWQIYVNNDQDDDFLGDYTDNTVRSFAAFDPAKATPENTLPREGLLARGGVVHTHTDAPAGITNDHFNSDYVLGDFIADCALGVIPEVSWIVAPAAWTEHPTYAPNNGAVYTQRVIKALHDNPELWESTLLILNYDEPDHANRIGEGGFMDHVIPPIPEPGTKDERAPGIYPGTGGRTPLVLVSPWTRGGYVASEVFDATSTIRFIEKWTTAIGKPAISHNINAWRRGVMGDMLSAIDFNSFDTSLPTLPDPAALLRSVTRDASLPPVPVPPVGAQVLPTQKITGKAKRRALPFQISGALTEQHSKGTVKASFAFDGPAGKAVSLTGFADKFIPALQGAEPLGLGQDALPMTVSGKGNHVYTWDTTKTNGQYAMTFHGPDHFVRSFAGALTSDKQHLPRVEADFNKATKKRAATVLFTVYNDGTMPMTFVFTPNDYAGETRKIKVPAGQPAQIIWPTDDGYHDVTIRVEENGAFMQRFAGRVAIDASAS